MERAARALPLLAAALLLCGTVGADVAGNATAADGNEIGSEGDALPSCNDVLLHETAQEKCHHAQNCEGEYLMTVLLPLWFCIDPSIDSALDVHPLLKLIFPILFPVYILLLTLLLFRLLGSTAENYFSPALEMLSSELRIPPALAGVTLLALGNGAPDVSAVVNAIRMSASEGIPLSLGELTGGGMFVQSVVVGRIVFLGSSFIAQANSGGSEKVLGIKCREELLRDISMYGVSASYVLWMCSRGVIFYRHVLAMLALYTTYVAVVFIYEIRRYQSSSPLPDATINGKAEIDEESAGSLSEDEVSLMLAHSYDEEDPVDHPPHPREASSEDLSSLHQPRQPDPPGMKQTARVLRVMEKQRRRQQRRIMDQRKSLNVVKGAPQDCSSPHALAKGPAIDRPWSLQLFSDAQRELCEHFHRALYTDIWSNSNLSTFEWCSSLLESPFIILRKLVVPIPCEDYNRSLVACAIACSPLWMCFYLTTKMDDFEAFPFALGPCCVSFALGGMVLKYAPKESLPLRFSLPISLYGFLIAATWIDVISGELVNVLEFSGVVLWIPAPIMGMTVLAWGNSVGDWTTNGTLAMRGLADMSMAACFAGPSFNLLVGLGCGLLTQKEALLSEDGLPIALMPSVKTGFTFLIANCTITILSGLWNKGVIPKMQGYFFWAAYFAFMAFSTQHLAM
ncbi:hypothetical protein ACHAXT_010222 [Thalassiosira profunda]